MLIDPSLRFVEKRLLVRLILGVFGFPLRLSVGLRLDVVALLLELVEIRVSKLLAGTSPVIILPVSMVELFFIRSHVRWGLSEVGLCFVPRVLVF